MFPMYCKIFGSCLVAVVLLYRWYRKRRLYSLAGKVVMITGSTAEGGLGMSLAVEARRRGAARVILTGRRVDTLTPAQNAVKRACQGQDVDTFQLDLDWPADKLTETIDDIWKSTGGIDVLINNAGCSYRGSILDTLPSVYEKLMKANFFGHVTVTTEIARRMKEDGKGLSIVGISSLQGKLSIPWRSAYSASKHAFQAFFDCLRAELACSCPRVTVLVVSPAYINTNLSRNAVRDTGVSHAKLDATTASGLTPESAASTILTAVERGEEEIMLSGLFYKIVVPLRSLLPWCFFRGMNKRAKSSTPY